MEHCVFYPAENMLTENTLIEEGESVLAPAHRHPV